jgi:hypothetical protein
VIPDIQRRDTTKPPDGLPHHATPEQAADLTPARIAAERKAKAEVVAEQVA